MKTNKHLFMLTVVAFAPILWFVSACHPKSTQTATVSQSNPKVERKVDNLNYFQPVRLLQQEKTNDCWATALTILYSWKNGNGNISISDVVHIYGEPYVTFYSTNAGIQSDNELNLYQKAGLKVVQQANPSINEWYNLLKSNGPLSITIGRIVGDPMPRLIIHALVVNGMKGDGTANNTLVDYVDPDGGQQHHLSFSEFLKLFELGSKYNIQIIHW